jgi:hypothetical protein
VSAIENLIFSDDLIIKDARADLEKKVSEKDHEKARDSKAYLSELKQKFNDLTPGKEESPENDLLRVMKIILWEHAQVFEKVTKS